MAVRFPDKVTVGGHEYRVLCPFHFVERSDLAAQVDTGLLEIRVNPLDLGGNPKPDSVNICNMLHEIAHAIDHVFADGKLFTDEKREWAVNVLAQGLGQALKRELEAMWGQEGE